MPRIESRCLPIRLCKDTLSERSETGDAVCLFEPMDVMPTLINLHVRGAPVKGANVRFEMLAAAEKAQK